MILMGIILWAYRSMQHPRLYLALDPKNGAPTARWQAIVRYVVLTPIMVFLAAVGNALYPHGGRRQPICPGARTVCRSCGGCRAGPRAHQPRGLPRTRKDHSASGPHHHSVGGILNDDAGTNRWAELLEGIDENVDVLNTYYYLLVLLDFVVTAFVVPAGAGAVAFELPNSNRRRFTARFAPFFAFWRSVRDFGKASTHKSTKQHEVTHHG